MANDKDTIRDIIEAETQALDTFQSKWDEGERNGEMLGLKLWTDKERKKIEDQGRIAYNLDRMNHTIGTLLGSQREARTEIFFYGRTKEDELRTELYNAVWKYFSDLHQYIHVESDVFMDGIVAKYGVFGCEMDHRKDPLGSLRVHRIPYNEVLWDVNFKEYDLSDAYWMSRMRFYQRDELMEKYPDKEDVIRLAGKDWGYADTRVKQDMWYKAKKDLIGTREFYEKSFPTKYFIWQAGADIVLPRAFDSKREAEESIGKFNAIFEQMVMRGEADPMNPPSYDIEGMPTQQVTKTVAVINGVLEEKHTFPMGDFPMTVYFPYFYNGDFWSAVDRVKDPQKFESRMYAQLDHWVGVMAKGLLRVDPRLSGPEKKKITENWSKTGGTIEAKEGQVEQIQGAGPAPQLFSLLDRVDALYKESFGGANMLGQKQTASESGRAVLARVAQASLDNLVALDNLSRTKDLLGKKIAWYISNRVTAPRVMRITGDDLTMQMMNDGRLGEYFAPAKSRPNVGYLKVNSEETNTITGLEVDVVVDEAQFSPTKNLQMLNQITDFAKTGLLSTPPPPEVIVDLLPIPYSLKQTWKNALAQQAQQPPQPEIKISADYKDLPPEAQVQVLESTGVQASTQQTADKQVFDKVEFEEDDSKADRPKRK